MTPSKSGYFGWLMLLLLAASPRLSAEVTTHVCMRKCCQTMLSSATESYWHYSSATRKGGITGITGPHCCRRRRRRSSIPSLPPTTPQPTVLVVRSWCDASVQRSLDHKEQPTLGCICGECICRKVSSALLDAAFLVSARS